MFLVLSLHKVYKARAVNKCRTVSTGSPRLTSALKPDLRMQSRNLLHLLDGKCPVFWLCQTDNLWNYKISFVRTWYSGNHTKGCHV